MSKKELILIGDSIFDNAIYVAGGPSVSEQITIGLDPSNWTVELGAIDGATTPDVANQITADCPETAIIALSIGGNDALQHLGLLTDNNRILISETLSKFYTIREEFRKNYQEALDYLLALGCPLIVCTIYNPDFNRDAQTKPLQFTAEAALSFFNDVITQEALVRSIEIMDLRQICTESEDFANPIEPSCIGGQKIAEYLCSWAVHKSSVAA